jgi:hypothetical protein
MVEQPDGIFYVLALENVKYVPKFDDNLFSIGSVLERGWQICIKGINISLHSNVTVINFNFWTLALLVM